MTDLYHQKGHEVHLQHQPTKPRTHQLVKAATAATAGGSLLVLSGLTLVGTVITLSVATPLLVIFSPVLVPAVVTVSLLAIGFLTSGGFGVAAMTVFAWMYRFVTGGRSGREESFDQGTHKMGSKGHHATGGVRLTTGARTGLYNQT